MTAETAIPWQEFRDKFLQTTYITVKCPR